MAGRLAAMITGGTTTPPPPFARVAFTGGSGVVLPTVPGVATWAT